MTTCSSRLLKSSSLVVRYRAYMNLLFTHCGSSTAMLQAPKTFLREEQIWVIPSKPEAEPERI